MTNNPNQPKNYDAILGGQSPAPDSSVVLGGVESVRRGLVSAVENQRIAALYKALKYGDTGLELVIQALKDESWLVRRTAYLLLKESSEPKVKEVLMRIRKDASYLLFQCIYILSEHSNWITSVAISPDGQILASGSDDKTIKLWSLGAGKLICTLRGHSDKVKSIAFSPDGQKIASASWDNIIKVWNLDTGELLHNLSGYSSITSIRISPDNQTLASSSFGKSIKLWNLHTGEQLHTLSGHLDAVRSFAISPDGRKIASGLCDGKIMIWVMQ